MRGFQTRFKPHAPWLQVNCRSEPGCNSLLEVARKPRPSSVGVAGDASAAAAATTSKSRSFTTTEAPAATEPLRTAILDSPRHALSVPQQAGRSTAGDNAMMSPAPRHDGRLIAKTAPSAVSHRPADHGSMVRDKPARQVYPCDQRCSDC